MGTSETPCCMRWVGQHFREKRRLCSQERTSSPGHLFWMDQVSRRPEQKLGAPPPHPLSSSTPTLGCSRQPGWTVNALSLCLVLWNFLLLYCWCRESIMEHVSHDTRFYTVNTSTSKWGAQRGPSEGHGQVNGDIEGFLAGLWPWSGPIG